MKISTGTYGEILSLLWTASNEEAESPSDFEDAGTVRMALIREGEGDADLKVSTEAYLALARLLEGRTGFDSARQLLDDRDFSGDRRNTYAAMELYRHSLILQDETRVTAADLASPKALIDRLVGLRQDIFEEQCGRNGSRVARKTGEYSLSTLVKALRAGGRLRGFSPTFDITAAARDLFDRSTVLRGGISDEDVATPPRLVSRLAELKPEIIKEWSEIRGGSTHGLSIGTLLHAVVAGGLLEGKTETYTRLASARDLFDGSKTLQDVQLKTLRTDKNVVRFLLARRDRIAIERFHSMGRLKAREFTFKGAEDHYALTTLAQALVVGGKISEGRIPKLSFRVLTPIQYFLNNRERIEPELRRLMALDVEGIPA